MMALYIGDVCPSGFTQDKDSWFITAKGFQITIDRGTREISLTADGTLSALSLYRLKSILDTLGVYFHDGR